MSPAGLTLADLYEMALGKAEMLGLTSGGNTQPVIPYDPKLLQ